MMALKQPCAKRAEVESAAYQPQLDQWISDHHWLGKDVEFLGTNAINFTMTLVVGDAIIMTLVTCKELQFPWKRRNSLVEQFPIKENRRVRCWPSFERICFSLPVRQLSHSCLGRYWEPPAFLAPVSFTVYQPNQGEARSWEALGWSAPTLTFFSSSGKTWEDIRCSEALSFCQGLQMVIWELTTHDLHAQQGFPQQGLFFIQPYAGIQRAQMMAVQDSWLFWPLTFPAQIQFSIKKP